MTSITDPKVQAIMNGRRIAVLGTHNADGSIHLTAVWYVLEQGSVYVGTSSRTRKGRNLTARPRASLVVDVRRPGRESGVSISGAIEIITGQRSHEINQRIQQRYLSQAAIADEHVGKALAAMDDMTARLQPKEVFTWDMAELDKTVFGGRFGAPGVVLPLDA